MIKNENKMKMLKCIALMSASREGIITLSENDINFIKDVLGKE